MNVGHDITHMWPWKLKNIQPFDGAIDACHSVDIFF
jgi:hypothetical protein